jgi:hypothetical protein
MNKFKAAQGKIPLEFAKKRFVYFSTNAHISAERGESESAPWRCSFVSGEIKL